MTLKIFYMHDIFMHKQIKQLRMKVENYLLNNPEAPLIIAADTLGGVGPAVIEASSAFRALRGGRITSYVSTKCWSSGLLVMAIADRRVALRGAHFMIHQPAMEMGRYRFTAQHAYNYDTLAGILEDTQKHWREYCAFLDERTGKTSGFWNGKAQPNPTPQFYTAEEMQEWGLITHIVDSFDEMRDIALQV